MIHIFIFRVIKGHQEERKYQYAHRKTQLVFAKYKENLSCAILIQLCYYIITP